MDVLLCNIYSNGDKYWSRNWSNLTCGAMPWGVYYLSISFIILTNIFIIMVMLSNQSHSYFLQASPTFSFFSNNNVLGYWNEQIIYSSLNPNGSMKLYEFIAIVTGVMIILSQLPTFHSLRHVNLGSLLLSFGYAFLVVAACIIAGIYIA